MAKGRNNDVGLLSIPVVGTGYPQRPRPSGGRRFHLIQTSLTRKMLEESLASMNTENIMKMTYQIKFNGFE